MPCSDSVSVEPRGASASWTTGHLRGRLVVLWVDEEAELDSLGQRLSGLLGSASKVSRRLADSRLF